MSYVSGNRGLTRRMVLVDTTKLSAGVIPITPIVNAVKLELLPFELPKMFASVYTTADSIDIINSASQQNDLKFSARDSSTLLDSDEYKLLHRATGGSSAPPHSLTRSGLVGIRLWNTGTIPQAAQVLSATATAREQLFGPASFSVGHVMASISCDDKFGSRTGRITATPLNEIVFDSPVTITSFVPAIVDLDTYAEQPATSSEGANIGYDPVRRQIYITFTAGRPLIDVGDYLTFLDIPTDGSPMQDALRSYPFSRQGNIITEIGFITAITAAYISPMPFSLETAFASIKTPTIITFGCLVSLRSRCCTIPVIATCVDAAFTQYITPVLE